MTSLSPRNLAAGIKTVPIERHLFSTATSQGEEVESGGAGLRAEPKKPSPRPTFQVVDRTSHQDNVAVEEPLEMRLAGDTLAVTMRTPGSDRELVVGHLLGEGIIRSTAELGAVRHCGRLSEGNNVVEVTAAPGTAFHWDPEAQGRAGVITSACGICGRRSVDNLMSRIEPLQDRTRFSARWVAGLTEQLSESQQNFKNTGGVHAAAFWPAEDSQQPLVVREDIGRHNAVDKVVGYLALAGLLPARGGALVVSGRVGFEIAQKAVVARVPLLVSVSAPTSLSIDVARRGGLTLVSFARAGRFNVYSGAQRIV